MRNLNLITLGSERVEARLHMRFLMRFLVRFRVQNAPYPTLHEYFFFVKYRVDWKESYHILFQDTLLSNFC